MEKKEKILAFLKRQKPTKKELIYFLAVWAVGILFLILCRSSFYGLNKQGVPSLLKKLLVFYLCTVGLISVYPKFRNPLSDKANRVLNVELMQWYPLISMLIVEAVFDSELMQMKLYRIVFNLLMYMIVMYLFYVLTGSVRVAMAGLGIVASLFGIVNLYLMDFRSIPLLASDLTVIRTAMNVAGSFHFQLKPDILYFLCFAVDSVLVALKLKPGKVGWVRRVAALLAYVCLVSWTLNVVIFSDKYPKYKININTFRPIKSYVTYGSLLTFTRSFRLMMVDKPEHYSVETVEDITEDFVSDSVSDQSFRKPNVIVIMDEAFADLQSVGNFQTNQEVMPFYRSLTEDTVKGFAYVSVFGGQTANSEFEFLTGDSKAFLPKGATPYQLYVKEYLPSLTGNLKLDNYQGMKALHPYEGSGYNRISVYQNFGFDEFITRADFENPRLVRHFISDEEDFSRIIEEYEKAKADSDDPFYLFNVTMQNHSSYDTDYDNLPDTIKITTPECQDADAERYLNLIHLSDAALKELLAYFEKQEDPTVIVMFGDHEPGLSDAFYSSIMGMDTKMLTDEESMELYKVPFLIWANYDIEERYIEKTSLNYLQSIMLEAAGMKQTGYNKFQLNMMEEIPAINISGYFGADGMYYDLQDQASPYYETVKAYQVLEYNHLFDSRRKNAFFELAH